MNALDTTGWKMKIQQHRERQREIELYWVSGELQLGILFCSNSLFELWVFVDKLNSSV